MIYRILWLAIMAVFLLTANFAAQAKPQARSLTFQGTERTFFIALPPDFDPETIYWPFVVVHGGGGNAGSNGKATAMQRVAVGQGLRAIFILPAFVTQDKQVSRFPRLGEGAFLKAVLDEVRKEFRLHKKILLQGSSMGGQFAHRFALANPELVQACAPFSAGTWTTPEGRLLIQDYGTVEDPAFFLLDRKNIARVPERLNNLFDERTAAVAGLPAAPDANKVPFLVMCGTLDPRLPIAKTFAANLRKAGFAVETAWPRTGHGWNATDDPAESDKYPEQAIRFFLKHTESVAAPTESVGND